jgi:hypothetical protein
MRVTTDSLARGQGRRRRPGACVTRQNIESYLQASTLCRWHRRNCAHMQDCAHARLVTAALLPAVQ